MIQTKIQIEIEDYDFIKKACRQLRYRSMSEYMRQAVTEKVKSDRKKLREARRRSAMAMIDTADHENLFESIEGVDFEKR